MFPLSAFPHLSGLPPTTHQWFQGGPKGRNARGDTTHLPSPGVVGLRVHNHPLACHFGSLRLMGTFHQASAPYRGRFLHLPYMESLPEALSQLRVGETPLLQLTVLARVFVHTHGSRRIVHEDFLHLAATLLFSLSPF